MLYPDLRRANRWSRPGHAIEGYLRTQTGIEYEGKFNVFLPPQ
jgi:hypothetical protein